MTIRRVVAMETVTLPDLTDAIISGTEPDVKTEGMLWIDGDNILKQWNGVSWDKVELDVSSLDPDLSETITPMVPTGNPRSSSLEIILTLSPTFNGVASSSNEKPYSAAICFTISAELAGFGGKWYNSS